MEYIISVPSSNTNKGIISVDLTQITIADFLAILSIVIIPLFVIWSKKRRQEFEDKVSDIIEEKLESVKIQIKENKEAMDEACQEARLSGEIMKEKLETISKGLNYVQTYLYEKNKQEFIPK